MKQALVRLLEKSIRAGIEEEVIAPPVPTRIEVELTKDPGHGDYASNIAMVLAKQARKNPREIARILSERIEDREGLLEKVEIAGPGERITFFHVDEIEEVGNLGTQQLQGVRENARIRAAFRDDQELSGTAKVGQDRIALHPRANE